MGAFACTDFHLIRANMKRVFGLFPRLKERNRQVAGTLSGGEQQMLAMGRALMANPRILLMDEPSMGLAPVLVDHIFDTIRQLHATGTTILLVEQNARMALQVSSRGYVLQTGSVVLTDLAENLRRNEMVRKAYLGRNKSRVVYKRYQLLSSWRPHPFCILTVITEILSLSSRQVSRKTFHHYKLLLRKSFTLFIAQNSPHIVQTSFFPDFPSS
jgi:ABC-type multidrug transport system ATPase subunit